MTNSIIENGGHAIYKGEWEPSHPNHMYKLMRMDPKLVVYDFCATCKHYTEGQIATSKCGLCIHNPRLENRWEKK